MLKMTTLDQISPDCDINLEIFIEFVEKRNLPKMTSYIYDSSWDDSRSATIYLLTLKRLLYCQHQLLLPKKENSSDMVH